MLIKRVGLVDGEGTSYYQGTSLGIWLSTDNWDERYLSKFIGAVVETICR